MQEGADIDQTNLPADPIHAEFREAIERAEQQAESILVEIAIHKARTTRDALDILERRFGGQWQQKTEIHVDVRHMLEGLANDPEELEAATAEAERLMGIR
jgi:hypothetical protein